MLTAKLISLLIFIAAYLLFVFLPRKRAYIAVLAAILLILGRVISFKEAFLSINWNVMGIFVGMLVVADIFMESRMPAFIAEKIVNNSKNIGWAMFFICVLSGLISAFLENVATVLIMAPIALSMAKKLRMNPVSLMIGIAVSSNLQGVATLIGDPPSMLLGGFAGMNFMDFFFYQGRFSIFFAVELGALISFLVLYFIFRRHKERTEIIPVEKIRSRVPSVILVLLILALAGSSFFVRGSAYSAGIICMIFALFSLIWDKIFNRSHLTRRIKSLDWETTVFLLGVFIIVGSLTQRGWIDGISLALAGLLNRNIFLGYILIVFMAMLLSAFVDNVPFLVAMLPVAVSLSEKLGVSPSLFLFGLLIGASLGGNITPIGASANIVCCGILKKEGYPVKFGDFVKIGLPFTLAAVTAASLFVWIVWAK